MRWLAALGVILLAFGVFVFVEARGSSSADADADVQHAPRANPSAGAAPTSATNQPTTTDVKRPAATLPALVESIRAKASAAASGAAPTLDGNVAAAGSAGSAERPADADDYLPYPDGSEPSSMRVKLRGAARRMNNGNYKGALEAADSLIQMYPDLWEAFTIAVPSLCAMGDQDKAAQYFGRVTDEDSRKQIVEGCAGFGVKL